MMRYKTLERRAARHDNRHKKWAVSGPSVATCSPARPIHIFIADSHEIVRAGVRALLEGAQDLDVVGEADDVNKVLSGLRRTKPNVILLESRLSGRLVAAISKMLHFAIRVIVLVEDHDLTKFGDALDTETQGFLPKSVNQVKLIQVIRTVTKGVSCLGPGGTVETFRLLKQQQDAACSHSPLHILSPQEQRVIALIAEGQTNREIAARLLLSEKTVKNYIANMFTKLKIARRTQAVALYMQTNKHYAPERKRISA